MKEKVSLLLSYDLEETFNELSDEEAGQLIRAIFAYERRNELPSFQKNTLLYFAFYTNIKLKIDKNLKKYQEVSDKRSEAGKQGGRPPKSKESKCLNDKAKKANALSEKQKKAKKAEGEGDWDCEGDWERDGDINLSLTPSLPNATEQLQATKKKSADAREISPVSHDDMEIVSRQYSENIQVIKSFKTYQMLKQLTAVYGVGAVVDAIAKTKAANGQSIQYLEKVLKTPTKVNEVDGAAEAQKILEAEDERAPEDFKRPVPGLRTREGRAEDGSICQTLEVHPCPYPGEDRAKDSAGGNLHAINRGDSQGGSVIGSIGGREPPG